MVSSSTRSCLWQRQLQVWHSLFEGDHSLLAGHRQELLPREWKAIRCGLSNLGVSGQRRFPGDWSSDSESDSAEERSKDLASGLRNALLVWSFDHDWMTVGQEPAVLSVPVNQNSRLADMPGGVDAPPEKPREITANKGTDAGTATPREGDAQDAGTAFDPGLSGVQTGSWERGQAKVSVASPDSTTGFAGLPKLVPFGQELSL